MAQDDANKATDSNDKPVVPIDAPALNNPDAQAARNASGADVASTEAARTNASDGSLRDRAKNIAAQEESIEIVYGDRTSSRADKKSERELLQEKITIGSKTYPADQVIAQANIQSTVMSDATNARATDVVQERTLLYGHISEPEVWDKVAKLPEKTQAEVILTAVRAHVEHWAREEADRKIGALIGVTEGIGTILQDMATVIDFNHACLTGDKETAAKMGAEFGDSIGRMLVGGVNALQLTDNYLQDLGAQGDWAKPAKDLLNLSLVLNRTWAELSPLEQERLQARFAVDIGSGFLIPGASARILKASKLTEVLPTMAKIAIQTGAELKEVPGDFSKARQGFRTFFEDVFAPEAVTTDGMKIKMTSEAKQQYLMNKADDLELHSSGREPRPSRQSGDAPKETTVIEKSDKIQFALNGIAPQEGFSQTMEVRNELREVCKAMKIDIDKKNIAYAEIEIDGQSSKIVGVNGSKAPAGTAGIPSHPKFETISDGAMPRDRDSEYKILERVAEKLKPDAVGEIRLFSEQKPCDPSCQYVIKKFQEKFLGIKIKTTWAFETKDEREWAVFEEIERYAARNSK